MEDMKEFLPENLAGKVVLITEGTTGTGRTAALLLALSGARLLITGSTQQGIDEAIADITRNCPEAIIYGAVNANRESTGVTELLDVVDSHFGKLDILVNTNGLDYENWTQQAIGRMKTGGGHIVTVSTPNTALQYFNQFLRNEAGRSGIKLTLIETGAVSSSDNQSSFSLQPDDVAMCILYCLSQPKRFDVANVQLMPGLQAVYQN